jgi:ubiquinone/menaquinone biosynthesis C-methylase UbiE
LFEGLLGGHGELTETPGFGRGHPFFAAVYGRVGTSIEFGRIGEARRALVAQATGVTLDLGSGIGTNLPLLPDAVTTVHVVEPDPHMIRRMRPTAPANAVVHQARGEDLPLDDDSVDTVLATLTLCTVQDVPQVLSEIRRVLRPGGRVMVLEHVLSTQVGTARQQRLFKAPWQWAGAGCNPDRETAASLAEAGFDTADLRRFRVRGAWLASEWVTGVVV